MLAFSRFFRARTLALTARPFSVNTKPKPISEVMPIAEALQLSLALSRAKSDESVEVRAREFGLFLELSLLSANSLLIDAQACFNLGVDPRKPGQNLRGTLSLPHGNGTKVVIAVLARGEKVRASRFLRVAGCAAD